MSGSYSRNKGRRLEQEIVNLLKDKGIDAKRISMLETGHEYKGDIALDDHKLKIEVKGGTQVPKFIYTARKTDEHLLCMRRDREKWLVCLDLEFFIEEYMNKKSISNKSNKSSEEVIEII